MFVRHNNIRERTNIIPIPIKNENLFYNNNTSPKNEYSPKGEYSLKQNIFDPSKSSPPNDFMLKLYMRSNMYDSILYNKDDKDDKA